MPDWVQRWWDLKKFDWYRGRFGSRKKIGLKSKTYRKKKQSKSSSEEYIGFLVEE
jgi:hypothetical protein